MLTQEAKDLFYKLNFEIQPVAVKFCYSQPKGYEHIEDVMSFCQFPEKAALEDRAFYTTVGNDDCMGKMILGMEDIPAPAASGQAGLDFGIFRTPAANARLYHKVTLLKRGAVNFVVFCPLHMCDFEPDILFLVADIPQAYIILRAASYISGDLWESTATGVISCSWLFSYPYVTGKVNYAITGLSHGMQRRKVYPKLGQMLISIPFQKLSEVIEALGQMDWIPIAMRGDEESEAELKRRMDAWKEMGPGFTLGHQD